MVTVDPKGRFEVHLRIGEGGMSTIYKAFDRELQRDVALKILYPDLAIHHQAVYRFCREADILRKLSRLPGFLDYYGFYELKPGGRSAPAIIMELLHGQDLFDLIRNNRRPLEDKMALEIALKMTSNLEELERFGIVHRDLKPENVFLENPNDPQDTERRICTLDFGICGFKDQRTHFSKELERALRSARPENPHWWERRLTKPNVFFGTPEYSSPESIYGNSDHRSDLFSLGATLFRVLTKELPYPSSTNAELRYKQNLPDPKHPDEIRTEKGYSSSPLSDICMRLLEKDPKNRYQCASELICDLSRIHL